MLRRILIFGGLIALIAGGTFAAFAQKQDTPPIAEAVYWSSPDAEVYLLQKKSGGFRLTVVSPKQFKVIYHTRINSIERVDKTLAPTSSANGITTYDFEHHFTKMTIWMALEFSSNGQTVPELTRTFLNDIHEVVANGYFDLLPKKKS
jgi:predicted ribosomally synthesized peptide with SipW-like signal peptide